MSIPGGKPATLFLGISVATLRVVSLAVLVAALLLGAYFGWSLLRDATSDDERRRIAVRYGPSLVEVEGLPSGAGMVVVDLASFEGLAQVSRRLECPLLHRSGVDGDAYGVVDNGTLYRYAVRASRRLVTQVLAGGNGNGNERLVTDGRGQPGLVNRLHHE